LRPELLAYCYRMLGSVHDAEDQVQETLLRAWRSFVTLQSPASLRTWLYRIATNACLRALETRRRRPLPAGLSPQPVPDGLTRPESADPAWVAVSRTNIRLALIAALQYLPARQRTVLILRDVMGWQAAEVAQLLGTTTTAVNSSLRRARARLRQVAPRSDEIREPAEPGEMSLLNRSAAAFEQSDVAALRSPPRVGSAQAIGPYQSGPGG
jgi:RNA polymerase sigma-70 factor, ECF subfamily